MKNKVRCQNHIIPCHPIPLCVCLLVREMSCTHIEVLAMVDFGKWNGNVGEEVERKRPRQKVRFGVSLFELFTLC